MTIFDCTNIYAHTLPEIENAMDRAELGATMTLTITGEDSSRRFRVGDTRFWMKRDLKGTWIADQGYDTRDTGITRDVLASLARYGCTFTVTIGVRETEAEAYARQRAAVLQTAQALLARLQNGKPNTARASWNKVAKLMEVNRMLALALSALNSAA